MLELRVTGTAVDMSRAEAFHAPQSERNGSKVSPNRDTHEELWHVIISRKSRQRGGCAIISRRMLWNYVSITYRTTARILLFHQFATNALLG